MLNRKWLPCLLLAVAMLLPLPSLAQTPPGAPAVAPTPTSAKKTPKSTTAVVNVNSDPAEKLQTVRGIGKATAQKVVANRPYSSLDDLVTKKAMTQKQLLTLKSQLSL